jgi:hypothetical protein
VRLLVQQVHQRGHGEDRSAAATTGSLLIVGIQGCYSRTVNTPWGI